MKVGTDGVLLGAWATVPPPGSRVLDLGTGTGLMGLMVAQRTREVQIDAVEIDPSSARQALENFQNSPWKDRISCTQSSFQAFFPQCQEKYDLIICNPPFFSASTPTPSREKNLARHDDSLSLEELFSGSLYLMKRKCLLSLILPAQKENQALDLIRKHSMHCRRKTRVIPAPGKAVHRVLLECSPTPGKCREDKLTIETGRRHSYSDAYNKLTEEFYLDREKGQEMTRDTTE